MLRILPTARMMIIKLCSLLQHKKLRNTKREKIKGRGKHHQNIGHLIQGILLQKKNQSKNVILPKAIDFKL